MAREDSLPHLGRIVNCNGDIVKTLAQISLEARDRAAIAEAVGRLRARFPVSA